MVSYTEEQILETIKENYKGEKKVLLLAPVVRSRKGHYHTPNFFLQLVKKVIHKPELMENCKILNMI